MAQVPHERARHGRQQRQDDRCSRLRAQDAERAGAPVDVIEGEGAHLAGPQAIRGHEQQQREVTAAEPGRLIHSAQEAAHIRPGQGSWRPGPPTEEGRRHGGREVVMPPPARVQESQERAKARADVSDRGASVAPGTGDDKGVHVAQLGVGEATTATMEKGPPRRRVDHLRGDGALDQASMSALIVRELPQEGVDRVRRLPRGGPGWDRDAERGQRHRPRVQRDAGGPAEHPAHRCPAREHTTSRRR